MSVKLFVSVINYIKYSLPGQWNGLTSGCWQLSMSQDAALAWKMFSV